MKYYYDYSFGHDFHSLLVGYNRPFAFKTDEYVKQKSKNFNLKRWDDFVKDTRKLSKGMRRQI